MTSEDCCYYGARGTRVGATSTHSSDGPSNISGYKPMHHEATKSFRNCNELFQEMDTWWVRVLSKNQNNKLCNESAFS
jgi:hypothetical protein